MAAAIIVLVLGCAAVAGCQASNAHMRLATDQRHAELRSVALLKVRQLEAWRLDRQDDARLAAAWAISGEAVSRWLADARDAEALRDLTTRLESLRRPDSGSPEAVRYQNVLVAAPDGRVLLSLDPTIARLEPAEVRLVDTAIRSGDAVLGDLERDTADAPVDIDVAVPLRTPGGTTFAALLLRTDPSRTLFPIVAWWPTDSGSAETLLVRRDGDRVVFLSPRRHSAEPALSAGVPLGRPDVAAVAAAMGQVGRFEGVDYRDVGVLADLRRVPGSDWLLVAKVDEAEIIGEARAEGTGLAIVILLIVALAGAVVALVLVSRQRSVVGRLYEAERSRSQIASRYDRLLAQARDIFLLFDDAGRIVEANDAAVAAYGHGREQLLRLGIEDVRAPVSIGDLDRQWDASSQDTGVLFETVHRRRDGTCFPVEVSSRVIDLDGRRYRQCLVRDISERRAADERLRRIATAHATLASTNALIVHAQDAPTLFAGVCATIVETGGYLGAWIGVGDAAADKVVPVARAGAVDEYIRTSAVALGARAPGADHPAGVAWREGRTVYVDAVGITAEGQPWREDAVARGIGAAASLPLLGEAGPRAVLTLYAAEPDTFTPETRAMLDEMADDLAYALGTFDQQAIRRRTEEALVAKEAELAGQLEELRRWYAVMEGREERVLELKEEVNRLLETAGLPARYVRTMDPDEAIPA